MKFAFRASGLPAPTADMKWTSAAWFLAAALGVALGAVLQAGWPHVGFDFSYFLPRLLDVRLHQLAEGWFSVQWWTPSFGAGLPAFANPQHTQFMPAQFLLPWFGPWGAVVAQASLLLAAGTLLVFHGCFRCLRCSGPASLIAAVSFGTSGFFWHHALTGHVGYNTYPLVAVLPIVLHAGIPTGRAVAVIGTTAALIIYSGGYAVILVYALTALLLASLLPLLSNDYRASTCWQRLTLGAALCCALAAAKVVAASSFLAEFPRLAEYRFPGSAAAGPLALLSQLFVMRSVALLSRWLPVSAGSFQDALGGGEEVGFGPIVPLILLLGALGALLHGGIRLSRRNRWLLAALVVSAWLSAEVALGRGFVWPWLKPLPFLRSLHENHRLAAAFVLPFALLVAPAVDRVMKTWTPGCANLATVAALLLSFAALEPMLRDRGGFWWSGFDATTVAQTWSRMARDPAERFVIERVADIRDDAVFLAGATSWKPYEPIFGYGYGGAAFRVAFGPGPVEPLDTVSGALRFHHPLSFVSPALAGTPAFAPLPASEAPALQSLLRREQPQWPLPPAQRFANVLTCLALLAAAALALWPARRLAALPCATR